MNLPPARHYRSFFWPAVLILAGVLALLANSGLISRDRLGLLTDLWPVILIVVGLEVIARRALRGRAADVAAILIVLLAAGGAIAYVALTPNPGATHELDSSASVGTLNQASLEVDSGAATITVDGSSSLGADLYRAHVEYSGPKPEISLDPSDGTLSVTQGSAAFGAFESRHFELRLQISSSVPWTISINSGAASDTYQLADVELGSLTIDTGASREDITLGAPSGAVPITVNGGDLQVHLHRPEGAAASVQVSGGLVSLGFDGHQSHAVGSVGNKTAASPDMYEVEINGGRCSVTMDTSGNPA